MLNSRFIFVLLAITFLFIQNSMAQQEVTVGNDFGVGARAMGMGGAFTSVADDFTALHWNPAGLSRLKRMEFFGGLSHEKLETTTKYFGDKSNSTFISSTKPNSFGFVFPISTYRGGLAFAFGVNRIQSFDSRITVEGFNTYSIEENPDFGQLYIDELSSESGDIYSWNVGAAVDIAPGVSLGGTLNFLSGTRDYKFRLDADDMDDTDSKLAGYSYLDTTTADYFGIESKIGLLAQVINKIRLGLTINIPLDFSVDEYWSQDSYYLYDDNTDESEYNEGHIPYDISRPFSFEGGISIYPFSGAIIAADASYTDWTQTQYSEPPSEDTSNEDFINDYKETLKFSIGGEYTISDAGLRLRAGYLIDPLPYNPSGTKINTDRRFITFGIGLLVDEIFSLDITYMRGLWKESIDDGKIEKDRNSNRIFLSAGYRF